MERPPLKVEVVSADRQVWAGDVTNIIARTTEGDVGILPGHEPMMAALVPCAVEIITADGRRETLAVDGGFISVADGKVWILSQDAVMGHEVSLKEAFAEAAPLNTARDSGEITEEELRHLGVLEAQIRAGEKAQAAHSG